MMVFPSSTELFYFYGQSLEQCANLSTGQPLHDLAEVHKKWLRIYAGNLIPQRIPSTILIVLSQRRCWPSHPKSFRPKAANHWKLV
jgi:vacuolar protein sorting-associated protein 53